MVAPSNFPDLKARLKRQVKPAVKTVPGVRLLAVPKPQRSNSSSYLHRGNNSQSRQLLNQCSRSVKMRFLVCLSCPNKYIQHQCRCKDFDRQRRPVWCTVSNYQNAVIKANLGVHQFASFAWESANLGCTKRLRQKLDGFVCAGHDQIRQNTGVSVRLVIHIGS